MRIYIPGMPCRLSGKEFACNTGGVDLIPGSGRSPGIFKGIQYSTHSNILVWEIPWREEPGGL